MTRINTNVASLRGLHNVQKAQENLNLSLQRLSTGLKINSGKDDPAGLLASEGLRLQLTTISQSIDNSNRANNVLSTADSALGEIGGLLNQVRGLVQQGLNSGALSDDEIKANQQQIDQALSAINRISANTTFAGQKLIDGSKAFNTALTASDAGKLSDVQINEALFGTSSTILINSTVTAAAEKAELRYNNGTLTGPVTLEVAGSKGNQVLFLGGSSSITNIRDAVNAVSDVTGVDASIRAGLEVGGGTAGAAVAATATYNTTNATASTLTYNAVSASNAVAASRTFTFGSDTLTVTADTAGAAGNNIQVEFVAGSGNNVALSAAQSGNLITVTLGTDGGGSLDATKNTVDLIETQINNIVGGTATATSSGNTTGATVTAAANLQNGADAVTAEDIVFTAATAGAAGNNLRIVVQTGGANAASAATVSGITTLTLTRTAGQTSAQFVNFINNDTTANALVSAAGTGTTAIGNNLASTALTGGADAESITFTAADPGFDGNNLRVVVNTGASNAVSTATAAGITTLTITKTAADTAATLASYINGNATASALISAAGTGTTAATNNLASTALTGGIDGTGGAVKFTDFRADGASGTISVVFADPSANDSALSISTSAADSQGNRTITVNLATNSTGNIITTADDIVAAITADATASTLVKAQATTDGVVSAASSADLAVGDDGELVLKSQNYGSTEFVKLNVLSGTFATTLADETTASFRDAGTDIGVNVNGQNAQGDGLTAKFKTGQLDGAISFKVASNVANTTATVTITGGGSLFQIGQQADASGQIGLGIDAVNTARLGGVAGKLYELGTGGGKSLLDVGPDVPAATLVDIIDQALNRVNNLRGRIGAIQKNVIDTNISNLGVALENISAARSSIIDTDFATETANLQKAQVLSQAGISVLTIANQVPQQVLSLLR